MKHSLTNNGRLYIPRLENSRVFYATIAGGAIILLMILAEMKFFGT